MASTYSTNLRLELIGTGEQQGTWGTTTNTNLGTLLEEAIGGYISVAVTDGADTTLTTNNGAADQSRNMVINLTGALTATRNVICPAIEKLYVVKNATTGGQSVVFKVSGQTGVTIPNGTIEFLYVDGTDARTITGSIASQDSNNVTITGGSITGITDLAIADGGTGASNASSARTNLGLGTGDSPQFTAVNIGNATDTTITRASAGVIAVEGIDVLLTGLTDTITVGYTVTPYNIGTVSSGTTTPSAANGNYQYYTNNGAHTLAAPAADCAIDILVNNGASAGNVAFSGFKTPGSGSSGSTYATTASTWWTLSIRRINGVSTYVWSGPWT